MKIIGDNTSSFLQEVTDLILEHFPDTPPATISAQPSQNQRYLSVRVTVHVQDQPSLDGLYQALTKHPDMKMVL